MGILRLLLALSVVLAHAGFLFGCGLVGGQVAVQSFYIISGFYMALILNEKYIGINASYKLFITNRLIRIYPIFWTVLLISVLLGVAVLLKSKGQNLTEFKAYTLVKPNLISFGYLIIANIIIYGQDLLMFMGIHPDTGHLYWTSNFRNAYPQPQYFLFIPQAWTLGVELTFYLLAPFILKRGLKLVLILIAASLLLRLYLYNGLQLQKDPWNYRFFPTEIMFFMFGYLSYRLNLKIRAAPLSRNINLLVISFIVLFTLCYLSIKSFPIPYFPFTAKECVYFLSIIISVPILFNYLKASKWDNRIGELSYPVYISHMLIYLVCSNLSHTNIALFAYAKTPISIIIFTIIFSVLLNRYIAKPIEKYRQSRIKVTVRPAIERAETEAL